MIDTYFHPRGREVTLTTSEYDGTYGAHEGSLDVRQCLVCAALVDAREIERHANWHESLTLQTDWADADNETLAEMKQEEADQFGYLRARGVVTLDEPAEVIIRRGRGE